MDYKRRRNQNQVAVSFQGLQGKLKFKRTSSGSFVCFCGAKYSKPQAFQRHAKKNSCFRNTNSPYPFEKLPNTYINDLETSVESLPISWSSVTELSQNMGGEGIYQCI
jgi:hypothetical protein